jgi:putative FmdB family regulatory protein
MPIYEYECEKCRAVFERWSKHIRDMEWTELCPHDGGTGHRIISNSSFILKDGGVGWAKDGYDRGKSEKPKTSVGDGTTS